MKGFTAMFTRTSPRIISLPIAQAMQRRGIQAIRHTAVALILLLGVTRPGTRADPASATPPIRQAAQLRKLSVSEADERRAVQLRGVITCLDEGWHLLFVQDESDSIFVTTTNSLCSLRAGQMVEVEGVSGSGEYLPVVLGARVKVVGEGVMPSPGRPSYSQLVRGQEDGRWVEVTGKVRSITAYGKRLAVKIMVEGKPLEVQVLDGHIPDIWPWLDAYIRVRGICGVKADRQRKPISFHILAPTLNELTILEAARPRFEDLPMRAIGSLLNPGKGIEKAQRVRLEGKLIRQNPGENIVLGDETGQIQVNSSMAIPIRVGQKVIATGFLKQGSVGNVIEDGIYRAAAANFSSSARDSLTQVTGGLPILERIIDIRSLPSNQANRYPVRVGGVVTCYFPAWSLLFVQDDTGGIYVYHPGVMTNLHYGSEVRIEGWSSPGKYAPIIADPKIEVIGEMPMPPPRVVTLAQLLTGQEDSQWVQTTGLARQAEMIENATVLELSSGGETIKVVIQGSAPRIEPDSLVDALLQVTGVCVVEPNHFGQLTGVQLVAPSWEQLVVREPSLLNPFSLEIRNIDSLFRFNPHAESERRVRVQGVVTLVQESRILHLQDNTGGIRIFLKEPKMVEIGRKVEVVGFPVLGEHRPVLRESLIRVHEKKPLPEPHHLKPADLKSGNFDEQRVTLEAILLFHEPGSRRIMLQSDHVVFDAQFEEEDFKKIRAISPGTRLQVTGICTVGVDEFRKPRSFHILCPNLASIVILDEPPGWVMQNPLKTLGILTASVCLALAWVGLLRRRVRQQTEHIQRQLDRESALQRQYRELFENAKESEARLILAQRIGRVGGWELDLETQTLQWSGETYRIFGCDPETFKPTRSSFMEMVHPQDRDRLRQAMNQALQKQQPYAIDHRIVLPDGAVRHVYEQAELVKLPDGQVIRLAGTVQDITERTNLEERLRHSQKMEAIGSLAGGVAHDFNNLLTIIQGYIGLILSDSALPNSARDPLREVANAAERAANLTRQLLAFSRRQVLQPQEVDLNQVVANLSKMLDRLIGEDIALEFRYKERLPRLRADVGMLEQVIMNLAVNARDAMPNGGALRVETSVVSVGVEHLQKYREAQMGLWLCLKVVDSGCGMDEATIGRIFEPFFTTKEVGKGTGLGLATAYGIVKQHGGWMEVESRVGQGTEFRVYLPAIEKLEGNQNNNGEAANEDEAFIRPAKGEGATILVVEDEAGVRGLVRGVLERHGYRVLEASNGVEALRTWEQYGPKVDLLLTDMVMPMGMSGRELASQLQERKPTLKVIYSSGYSLELAGKEIELRNGVNFLQKPYHPKVLLRAVEGCLYRR